MQNVSPSCGPSGGGTIVDVTASGVGEQNGPALAVTIGGVNVPFNYLSDRGGVIGVEFTSPPHASGTVDIRVENVAGFSAVTASDHFTYEKKFGELECRLLGGPLP